MSSNTRVYPTQCIGYSSKTDGVLEKTVWCGKTTLTSSLSIGVGSHVEFVSQSLKTQNVFTTDIPKLHGVVFAIDTGVRAFKVVSQTGEVYGRVYYHHARLDMSWYKKFEVERDYVLLEARYQNSPGSIPPAEWLESRQTKKNHVVCITRLFKNNTATIEDSDCEETTVRLECLREILPSDIPSPPLRVFNTGEHVMLRSDIDLSDVDASKAIHIGEQIRRSFDIVGVVRGVRATWVDVCYTGQYTITMKSKWIRLATEEELRRGLQQTAIEMLTKAVRGVEFAKIPCEQALSIVGSLYGEGPASASASIVKVTGVKRPAEKPVEELAIDDDN